MRALGVLAIALAAACAGAGPGENTGESDVTSSEIFGSEASLFGNDRVGRLLKDDLGKIPVDYPAYEKVFSVGRSCARSNSKEIFIVEESRSRNGAEDESTDATTLGLLAPRAVISGCNTGDAADPKTLANSYSLFAALISSKSAPNFAKGDTMKMTPVEVMALDDTSGLYNFYIFRPDSVTRFWRDKDGKVVRRVLETGAKAPSDVVEHHSQECFGCHVNGAPLMNELREPWTNWISPKKKLPQNNALTGDTKELVDAASLADKLETIIRAGTAAYINGADPQKGWLTRTLEGKLSGGTAEALEPVFCQTEMNFLSADPTKGIPLEAFFDPAVAGGAGIIIPKPPSGELPSPFLLPVRSVRDTSVERALVRRGYLTDGLVVAARLLDDENDVFSAKRCDVFSKVKAKLGSEREPAKVQAIVKTELETALQRANLTPAQLAYAKARLAGTPFETEIAAYNEELHTRFDKMPKDVAPREKLRKAETLKDFPEGMLPKLDRD